MVNSAKSLDELSPETVVQHVSFELRTATAPMFWVSPSNARDWHAEFWLRQRAEKKEGTWPEASVTTATLFGAEASMPVTPTQ